MDRATAFYVEALARMGPWKATQKRVRTRWPAARAWAILAGAAEAYRRNGGDRSASQGLRVLGSTAAPPGLRLGARWRSVDLAHRRGRPGSLDDLDAALQATGGAAAEVRGTRWANTRVGDLGEATSRRILLALHRRVIAGEAPAEPLAHSAGQHHLVFGDQPDAWRVDRLNGLALDDGRGVQRDVRCGARQDAAVRDRGHDLRCEHAECADQRWRCPVS